MSGQSTGHRDGSGFFGADTVHGYLSHGPDGEELMDGVVFDWMQSACPGWLCADLGGGRGWASIAMLQAGATSVRYCDLSPAFVSEAEGNVAKAKVEDRVRVLKADVQALPKGDFPDSEFGAALSVNVGCAIDSAVLYAHVREMARILRPSGRALITAPASLEQPFLIEGEEDALIRDFERQLESVRSIDELKAMVKEGTPFHRATLVWDDTKSRARLVNGEKLADGTPIWRIISRKLVVPNFWHSREEYAEAIRAAGLHLVATEARLLTSERRSAINEGQPSEMTLGPRYMEKPAFSVYRIVK